MELTGDTVLATVFAALGLLGGGVALVGLSKLPPFPFGVWAGPVLAVAGLGVSAGPAYRQLGLDTDTNWLSLAGFAVPAGLVSPFGAIVVIETVPFAAANQWTVLGAWAAGGGLLWFVVTFTVGPRLSRGASLWAAWRAHLCLLRREPWPVLQESLRATGWYVLSRAAIAFGFVTAVVGLALFWLLVPLLLVPLGVASVNAGLFLAPVAVTHVRSAKAALL